MNNTARWDMWRYSIGKTQVFWNGLARSPAADTMPVDAQNFEILGESDSTMYLGRLVNLRDTHDTELKNRSAKAWAKFSIYRNKLTSKHYPLAQRMRLFAAVVQTTFLYGCASWTMTRKERERLGARSGK